MGGQTLAHCRGVSDRRVLASQVLEETEIVKTIAPAIWEPMTTTTFGSVVHRSIRPLTKAN
jgi:hypothetical protein